MYSSGETDVVAAMPKAAHQPAAEGSSKNHRVPSVLSFSSVSSYSISLVYALILSSFILNIIQLNVSTISGKTNDLIIVIKVYCI